jgi:hypothetical protein
MKRKIALFALLFAATFINAQVQSPTEYLGYELGTYFTRHHQVVAYFNHLNAEGRGKIKVEQYGKTNENRELIVAFISTPENLNRLEEIRKNHEEGKNEQVAIVWMSYNVHGNESAGTEAALLTAYELISQKQDWLKNVLVIMDPCINPDGRDRYVNWYNQKMNIPFNPHAYTNEHDEPWPSGRPNHYLFDLNRDWAWLTQVESQQRLKLYNRWLPHVHVDFHEQGMNDPYYFAPAAEPFHEVITNWQREFQNGLGRNHAGHFDKNGWFYFTREIFDLLYPSYGDTYPTYNGAIGMTYEQGGSGRGGLGVINGEGDTLTLKDRLTHHHISGLSTVEYSAQQKDKLISEFNKFNTEKNYKYKSYVVGGNTEKVARLRELLDQHEILYTFGNGITAKGFDFSTSKPGSVKTSSEHLIISTKQKKGTLVNVLFEPNTKLSDSMTYDITAWSLPYAYGLNCIASEVELKGADKAQDQTEKNQGQPENKNTTNREIYAYLIPWESMSDAAFLSTMLQRGMRVRYAEQAFTFGERKFAPGTLIIVKAENTSEDEVFIREEAKNLGIRYETTHTGMVDTGKDFGSSSVKLIRNQRIGVLSGDQTNSLNVGEVWHFFEKELHYPISIIDAGNLGERSLATIDILIVPEGWYGDLGADLKTWVNKGGKVIAIGDALAAFTTENGYGLKAKANNKEDEEKATRHEHAHTAYDAQEREMVKEIITGAIFKAKVETSNPLAFGYSDTYFTLKLNANAYEWLENGGNVVYLEKNAKQVAGFAGCNALPKQAESLVLGVESMGRGSLIYLVDNPLFRGFWDNGKLFFVNALFFTN